MLSILIYIKLNKIYIHNLKLYIYKKYTYIYVIHYPKPSYFIQTPTI